MFEAWKDGSTNALAVATALSQQGGHTLPWKTVRDAIGGALQARFIALADGSAPWPCEMPAANTVKLTLAESGRGGSETGTGSRWPETVAESQSRVARAVLEPSEVQDLADLMPQLLEIRTQANTSLKFRIQIEFGNPSSVPTAEQMHAFNLLLRNIKDEFQLE